MDLGYQCGSVSTIIKRYVLTLLLLAFRFNLGLYDGPPQGITDDDAYQDVKPRWPLTNVSDGRGLPKSSRGMRVKRLHTSLTELTSAAMAETTVKKSRGDAAESSLQAPVVACSS